MNDLTALSDEELLRLRSAIDREAKRRKLRFDTGGLGEKLVVGLFRERPDLPVLSEAAPGTKNIDAISRDGDRYSIKTLLGAKKTGTIYPDPHDPRRQLFEFLVIAILNEDLSLEQVVVLSWEQFCVVRSWDKRMNAWYVAKTKRALSIGLSILPRKI